jgi:hypothetical protein
LTDVYSSPSETSDDRGLTSRIDRQWIPVACGLGVVLWGVIAAVVYWREGLTLSHYDAKAHLVVARRVLDSLTPTWRQIGAVWLPLPHLLDMLPVQVDALYRTGASGVVFSVLSGGLAAASAAALVLRLTASTPAAVLTAALIAFNPNLLYLQSTPMTEPLLIGLLMLTTLALVAWVEEGTARWHRVAGWAMTGAFLTRYEAWPFTVAALVLTGLGRWRRTGDAAAAVRGVLRLALYPALAGLAFVINSRLSTGAWFVSGGFYVAEPALEGKPLAVSAALWWGTRELGSWTLALLAPVAFVIVAWRGTRSRRDAVWLVPLSLFAVSALSWYAFFEGHPFRVRYMVPIVGASVVAIGLVVGSLPRRFQAATALIVGMLVVVPNPPFSSRAPMVLEAQWDVPHSRERQAVTACLAARREGEAVLVSMGSLAHYMQELSRAGFDIADFVHEGNGEIWVSALENPSRYVGWILAEERAEGGDEIARRIAAQPEFIKGFTRVCSGGGVALYRIDRGLPISRQ